jgi:hypothetical protein
MGDACTSGTPSGWICAAFLALAVVSACAPKVSRRQTDIMEQTGKVSVSATVLRVRVGDLVDRFAGRIEQTADRIIAETQDDAVRRRALVLKVDVIPAMYAAGFRADPLAAAVDVWGFAFQFSDYVENGAGRNAFAVEQTLIRESARDLLADADAVIKSIAIRPEYFDQARARVEGWAKTHPVEQTFSSRASGVALVADLRSDEQDAFLAVGVVSDMIEVLSERLNTYAAQLPKQARWQAEILITGMSGAHSVESALGNLQEVGTAARRTADLLADVPGLFRAEREILADERRAVLAGVDSQRIEALEYITAERFAVLAAAREERIAVVAAIQQELIAIVAALRQERIEALKEADAIRTRAMDSGLAGLRDVVDYALWRLATLLAVLLFATVPFAVIAYSLTIGRRRRSAIPTIGT